MPKLFMLLIGCTPAGRHTEQHDVFFGVGESLADLIPAINDFWPEVKNKFHLDAWREVKLVDGYQVQVVEKTGQLESSPVKLFFLNLGGYKPGEFEEFHYKIIVAAPNKAVAIRAAKKTTFYRHTSFKTAPSHVDDKYGIDVDDAYEIKDILNPVQSARYKIVLKRAEPVLQEDILHLGYFKISSLK
jgi:hypothetical protein